MADLAVVVRVADVLARLRILAAQVLGMIWPGPTAPAELSPYVAAVAALLAEDGAKDIAAGCSAPVPPRRPAELATSAASAAIAERRAPRPHRPATRIASWAKRRLAAAPARPGCRAETASANDAGKRIAGPAENRSANCRSSRWTPPAGRRTATWAARRSNTKALRTGHGSHRELLVMDWHRAGRIRGRPQCRKVGTGCGRRPGPNPVCGPTSAIRSRGAGAHAASAPLPARSATRACRLMRSSEWRCWPPQQSKPGKGRPARTSYG